MSAGKANIEQRLGGHPFLKGVDARHLKVLAQSAIPTQFEKDQLIFKAGEPANGFYLIESGKVELQGSVLEHGPIATDVVGPGEPTSAVCLSGIALRQHRDEDAELSHELFKRTCAVMAHRLQSARRKLVFQ